ncbi:MAG: cytidine deaminase [Xanthomonadales bacterium]|jgi:cytidine deaminase|nr:cytidine deaminase [Xanthomonadales bacterium]
MSVDSEFAGSGQTPAVTEALKHLRAPAEAASSNAHAPYSGYHVGAALIDVDGAIYAACNVESASYGLTQCAERNALGSAISAGVRPGTLEAIVIYIPGDEPIAPCGACRQVMRELMAPHAVAVSCCDGEATQAWTLEELLPAAFLGR